MIKLLILRVMIVGVEVVSLIIRLTVFLVSGRPDVLRKTPEILEELRKKYHVLYLKKEVV